MNPTRNVVYTCADPSELMGFPEQQNDQPAEIDHTGNRLEEISYQKKIMPWEMMLETDVELTKSLVQKKVSTQTECGISIFGSPFNLCISATTKRFDCRG